MIKSMVVRRIEIKQDIQQVGSPLLTALDERWENYRTQVKTCRREFSEEAVHDLRVSTRRLLAALDIVRALDPHPRLQKVRRVLKDQIDDLDDLRDVQVMLAEAVENIERFGELQSFVSHLQEQEAHFLRKARKQVNRLKLSELRRRIEKIRDSIKKRMVEEKFRALLFQAVDNVYARTVQVLNQVDASRPGTIHRLRLAFKKFRYTVEVVCALIANYPEKHRERMHEYQSAMGDIHDIEVFLNTLADFSESGAASFDIKPVCSFYEKRHAELIASFMDDKAELFTFWRAASDQPFPWEQKHELVHHPSRHRRGSNPVRGRGQPASADPKGAEKDAFDRTGTQGAGNSTRSDSDKPLPARDTNRTYPGKKV